MSGQEDAGRADGAVRPRAHGMRPGPDFSLFYFADDGDASRDGYRLLIEGAKFADTHGFAAVWTPERHFHQFGGPYPNPAVTGAAVAAVTQRVGVRAGSVVAPLHHPLRIAEEWAVVDRLSGGRAGVAFASGWHAVDFALRPESYERRKEVLVETVETVRRLWRQQEVAVPDGTGAGVALRTFPAPVQPDLPIWVTSAGSPDTFRAAGRLGAGVLTHLLGQEPEELAAKISAYRESFVAHGERPAVAAPHVVLMLHSFVSADRDVVREVVRRPFGDYLRSSISLILRTAKASLPPDFDPASLAPADVDFLVERSFDRYFETGGLFGTPEDAERMVRQLRDLGVDEIACLIDFGVDVDLVLDNLHHLDEVRRTCQGEPTDPTGRPAVERSGDGGGGAVGAEGPGDGRGLGHRSGDGEAAVPARGFGRVPGP